jgi:hypothetical protein
MVESSEPGGYLLTDAAAVARGPLLDLLNRMAQHTVRYAIVNFGPRLQAYTNDALAAALERGATALADVVPYRIWEGPVSELMKLMPRATLEMRKAVGLCEDNHSTPSPPAYLGGTCRCSKTIILIV